MQQTLKIAYLYPENLNLYGDNGNIEVLVQRARLRGFNAEVTKLGNDTDINTINQSNVNFVFMGGGPDSGQRDMYRDLLDNKGEFLKSYIENQGVGLFICGSYQLLGHYYKSAEGSILDGLGIFDLYTQHFGPSKARCIGNTLAKLSTQITNDPVFNNKTVFVNEIVGFENHGGRTYLGSSVTPLATVVKGYGNNSEDLSEGALYKNAIGTYFHGPFLAKNPHFADYLIAKALNVNMETFIELDDSLALASFTASKKLKQ